MRGPASVLYGTDSFGGVVNIITRNPREREEYGSNAGARYSFDAARDSNRVGAYLDFGDKPYGVVLGGSYSDVDEPNLPDDQDPKSGSYKNWGLWGKSDFQVSDDSKIRLIANYTKNRDILITDDTLALPIALFPPPGSSELIVSPLFFEIPEYTALC
jgi:outer membrane receptor protein involved in Fe transport